MKFKNKLPVGKEIIYCKECKHRYSKDFYSFCKYRVGPVKPSGYCEKGERNIFTLCKDCIYHASFFPVCTYEPQMKFVKDDDMCRYGEPK